MRIRRQPAAWGLSFALHLVAAAAFGWFATRSLQPAAPARIAFAAVDIALADTAVSAAAGAGDNAAESDIPLQAPARPEPVARPDERRRPPTPAAALTAPAADTPVTLPEAGPRPPDLSPREARFDEKTPFAPDPGEAADPAQIETVDGSGAPGSGDGPGTGFGSGTRQASARAVIRPIYPVGARRRGEEGRVVIELTVRADGRTDEQAIIAPSGFSELDRAAANAIRRARFAPATRGGRPVASRIRLTFLFRLRD